MSKVKCKGTQENPDYRECSGCDYLYTHLGDHWIDDIVRCDAPATIKKGQTITEKRTVKITGKPILETKR